MSVNSKERSEQLMEQEPEEKITFTESAKVDNIKKFLMQFKDESENYKYLDRIDALSGSNLMIERFDLFDFERESTNGFKIWEFFMNQSSEAIKCCKRAVKEVHATRHGFEQSQALDLNILIDKSELEISVSQSIKNKFVNKLISLQARVTGESEIKPRIAKGVWLCKDGHETEQLEKPFVCDNPSCKHRNLELDKDKTDFEYYRNVYLKDFTNVDHNADALICEAQGELIDVAKVGEAVNITGYITIENHKNKFFNILHLLNIKKVNEINYKITDSEKETFRTWTKQPGYWDKLVTSIAPNIYNSKLMKTAYLLAYVGGTRWTKNQRYWINVLAVGDSGTAKSKIAEWGQLVLPDVCWVSSNSGSPKGLFAGQREQVDGEKVLEVGPMITASGRGLLCIDEFVRSKELFPIFYSPMETGVFNSATVGGHADLPCETPVYATGNPKNSNRWDEDKSILENLDVVERSLLSRFDLIIIALEQGTKDDREAIANSILDSDDQIQNNPDVIDEVSLVKLLLYAKTFKPTLTQKAKDVIIDTFQDVFSKKKSEVSEKYAETNYRFVGMMARVVLAISKLHFHNETTEEDVTLAHSLIKEMFAQRGMITNLANTYVDRVAQLIHQVLKESKEAMTDPEIHMALFARFPEKADALRKDIGEEGSSRTKNRRWRAIMDSVESSVMVEVQQKHPRKLCWLHDQRTLGV